MAFSVLMVWAESSLERVGPGRAWATSGRRAAAAKRVWRLIFILR